MERQGKKEAGRGDGVLNLDQRAGKRTRAYGLITEMKGGEGIVVEIREGRTFVGVKGGFYILCERGVERGQPYRNLG